MAYAQGGTRHRGDISAAVMEADGWETDLIAKQALPSVTTEDETGEYPHFKLLTGNLLKRESTIRRAPGAASARGDFAYEWDTYAAVEYSFEYPVDRVERMKADKYFDMQVVAAKLAKRKLLLEREIIAASTTFSTSNYGSAANSGTAYTIANIATFDMGLDIDAAKEVLRGRGEGTNELSIIMSSSVFNRARASTKLQNRLRGIGVSSDTILNVDQAAVAEALGVKEVLVGRAYYDSTAEGVATTSTALWSNAYMWVGRLGTGGNVSSMLNGAAKYTIIWSRFGGELSAFDYEEQQTKSVIVGVEEYRAEKCVNSNAGTLIDPQFS